MRAYNHKLPLLIVTIFFGHMLFTAQDAQKNRRSKQADKLIIALEAHRLKTRGSINQGEFDMLLKDIRILSISEARQKIHQLKNRLQYNTSKVS